jgi:hypothetical protein
MEIVDVEDGETKPTIELNQPNPTSSSEDNQQQQQQPPQTLATTYPGGFAIDVCFEASKLPLDVAIFNSARAAGGDEKIRKYLQGVLVVGGSALVPGMAHALESRWVMLTWDYSMSLCSAYSETGYKLLRLRLYQIWRRFRLYLLPRMSILVF